jgi:hypothetical protein
MDFDDPIPITALAEVWKILWDSGGNREGTGISFESRLVDDLLLAVEQESVDQDCPGVCDSCMKVSCLNNSDYYKNSLVNPILTVIETTWVISSLSTVF